MAADGIVHPNDWAKSTPHPDTFRLLSCANECSVSAGFLDPARVMHQLAQQINMWASTSVKTLRQLTCNHCCLAPHDARLPAADSATNCRVPCRASCRYDEYACHPNALSCLHWLALLLGFLSEAVQAYIGALQIIWQISTLFSYDKRPHSHRHPIHREGYKILGPAQHYLRGTDNLI